MQRKNIEERKLIPIQKISRMIEKKIFIKLGSDKNFTNITHLDFYETYNFMYEAYNKNKKIFIKEVK